MQASALFISHGAPTAAIVEDDYSNALEKWGRELGRPDGIIVLSAHGVSNSDEIIVSTNVTPNVIYDFSGFPEELYRLSYPCKGSIGIAKKVLARLKYFQLNIKEDRQMNLDHGIWVPLLRLFPTANVPVVTVTLPYPGAFDTIFQMGKCLAPLRDENILIVGSGGAVHNLRALSFEETTGKPDAWARAFQEWCRNTIHDQTWSDLCDPFKKAPDFTLAHPHPDHFMPVLFTAGAILPSDEIIDRFEGFTMRNLSLYSFEARHV